MASISIRCPSCSATEGVVRNGKSTAGHQRYLCSHCRKTWQLQFTYTASQPGYTVADAAKAMDVGLSTMTRWVKQLRDERQGKTPKASPITPEQIEIRKLRKKLQRIEMENEILKRLPRS